MPSQKRPAKFLPQKVERARRPKTATNPIQGTEGEPTYASNCMIANGEGSVGLESTLAGMISAYSSGDIDAALVGVAEWLAAGKAATATFWNVAAACHWARGDYASARTACEHSLALEPGHDATWCNLALSLIELEELDSAIAASSRAIRVNPRNATAYNILGLALNRSDRIDEATIAYKQAISIDPSCIAAQKNLSLLELLKGDFTAGLPRYEWRNLEAGLSAPDLGVPRWTGEQCLAGKRLFVYHEQGLGDTIQFIRYAGLARALGAEVFVSVQDPLVPLLENAFAGVVVLPSQRAPARLDFHIPLLSMPLAFKTQATDIPANIPYLRADPVRRAKWRDRLSSVSGFRIAICWQGNVDGPGAKRSFPISAFAEIANLPHVRLISLCKGEANSQVSALDGAFTVEVFDDMDPPEAAFLDSAAIMAECDLVITADTSTAHLAGALGVPTWLLLKCYPDWRWGLKGDHTPWYPTVRLFRQAIPGDWREPFTQIARELRTILADRTLPKGLRHDRQSAAMPRVAVSWGEVFDKLTILSIKSEKLQSPKARARVQHEHQLLEEVAKAAQVNSSLIAELTRVNRELWECEDAIRDHERRKDFGEGFTRIARAIYVHNDERARLKRAINNATGSVLQEEKSYSAY